MKRVINTKIPDRHGGCKYTMIRTAVDGSRYGCQVVATPAEPRQAIARRLWRTRADLREIGDAARSMNRSE